MNIFGWFGIFVLSLGISSIVIFIFLIMELMKSLNQLSPKLKHKSNPINIICSGVLAPLLLWLDKSLLVQDINQCLTL